MCLLFIYVYTKYLTFWFEGGAKEKYLKMAKYKGKVAFVFWKSNKNGAKGGSKVVRNVDF